MRVINIKLGEQYTHYAGRDYGRHKSIGLGNPFIVGKHGGRGECCDLFERLILADFLDAVSIVSEGRDDVYGIRNMCKLLKLSIEELESLQSDLWDAIRALPKDAVLGCWCKPQRCHCDSIVRYSGESA